MCNLYTCKMSADEMRGLMSHYRLIGTTWTERMRTQNEPINDVYPTFPPRGQYAGYHAREVVPAREYTPC
jgi:hypothetical protein